MSESCLLLRLVGGSAEVVHAGSRPRRTLLSTLWRTPLNQLAGAWRAGLGGCHAEISVSSPFWIAEEDQQFDEVQRIDLEFRHTLVSHDLLSHHGHHLLS